MHNYIKFVDNYYSEKFRVPDGGEITVWDSYDNELSKFRCEYIDDYHFRLIPENNTYENVYHIHQFAELMERYGNKYEPVIHGEYKLETPAPEEAELATSRSDAGSIGIIVIEFKDDRRMFVNWTDKNDTLNTDVFHRESLDVLNFFRFKSETPILRNSVDMENVCETIPSLKKDRRGNDANIFKVKTDKHTYYLRYRTTADNYASKYVHIYCYDTAELNRYKDVQFVNQNYGNIEADKFFRIDGGFIEEYYNPDATAGGQLVYVNISDDVIREAAKSKENMKDVNLFFSHLAAYGRETLLDAGDMGFRGEVDEFMNTKADFEGCTKKSMNGILKAAGVKIKDKDIER